MLEVNALSRRYGEFVAVDDTNFTIDQGEIVGLLGHNGAGKTTIMKMLSGYLEPSSGTIKMGGVDIDDNPNAIQRQLGYLPESLPIYPEMSVADYLDYAAEMKGLKGVEKTAEIKKAVASTEIASKLFSPIATLSRGFKQRVGVSQAILGQPKLLILDEPTNGLDPEQTQQMRDLIRMISHKATVILSTHIMQEVDALCDRVLILRAGQLVIDEKLEVLQASNDIELSTSLTQDKLQHFINGKESIKGFAQTSRFDVAGQSAFSYRFSLIEGADHQHICAELAAYVTNADQQLYQLNARTRDLESVFREVNSKNLQGGHSNAA